MTTFNRDQLSDWLHDFLPEEMRERFVVHSVHSKTFSRVFLVSSKSL